MATVPAPAPAIAAVLTERPFVADAAATPQTDGTVFALAQQSGVVYAGGQFGSVRPPRARPGVNEERRTSLAAFDAITGRLLPCAPVLASTSGTALVNALTVSPDGTTLFVGGRFSQVDGQPVQNLAAIRLSTCTAVTAFPGVNNTVYALATGASTLYVGGDFTRVGGQARTRLAALGLQGGLLAWAPSADRRVRALTVTASGGRVYAGGKFATINAQSASGVVALNPSSGAVVQTFPGAIDVKNTEVKALAHDDTNVYLGAEGTGTGVFDGRIALNADTGQQVWRDNCLGATQAVLPYRGLLYSASHAHDCSTTPGGYPEGQMEGRQHLLAQDLTDAEIQPWFPDTNDGPGGKGVGGFALTVSDGVLWMGGMFTTVNKRPQQGLVRFTAGPDVEAPARVDAPAASSAPSSSGRRDVSVSWQTSWDRDDGTLTYQVYRDGASDPVYTTTASSRLWFRPRLTFTDPGVSPGAHTYTVIASDGVNRSEVSEPGVLDAGSTPTNWAPSTPATQSSTDWGAFATRAVDGRTDGDGPAQQVTHTNVEVDPWWQTDLGVSRSVRRLVVWNRTDCCTERLSDFYVMVSDSPFTSTDLGTTLRQPGVRSFHVTTRPDPSVTLTTDTTARYVRVQLNGSGILSLAEMQVFDG